MVVEAENLGSKATELEKPQNQYCSSIVFHA